MRSRRTRTSSRHPHRVPSQKFNESRDQAGRSLLEKSNESLAAPSASTALVAAEGEVVSEATVYWKPTLRVRAVVLQQDFQRGSMFRISRVRKFYVGL